MAAVEDIGDADKRVLRALLARMRQTNYAPTVEERHVLAGCEQRAARYGLAAGGLAAAVTAAALRRSRFGLTGSTTFFRGFITFCSAGTAAMWGAANSGDACLEDLVRIAPRSPLGGEAVRLLLNTNPQSPLLKLAPKASLWEPDNLPRLPQPAAVRASIKARVAGAPKARKADADADEWGAEQSVDVFGAMLEPEGDAPSPSPSPARPHHHRKYEHQS
jgi:hypothetical protein